MKPVGLRGWSAIAAAVCLAGACSATSEPTTTGPAGVSSTGVASTSSTTSTSALATSTTNPPTLETTSAQRRSPLPVELAESTFATTYGEFGLIAPLPDGTDDAIGSGCTVDGALRDGVWFGHILEDSIRPDSTEVAFDLACVDDYDPNYGSWTMTNTQARVRQVPIRSDTRFVVSRPPTIRFEKDGVNHIIAQTPWTIVRPQDASTELTDELIHGHDWMWGWALIEDGVMVEFFDTDRWRIANVTQAEQESTIQATVYPRGPDGRTLTADDGFDGSGCSPDADSLPDGTWFGYVKHASVRDIRLDLVCVTSNPAMWERLGLDVFSIEDRTSVDDGDPTEYPLPIAPDAILHLAFIDHNPFQTPLTIDDPRYLHFVGDPRFQPGVPEDKYVGNRAWWVTVEDGAVTEAFVPFEV